MAKPKIIVTGIRKIDKRLRGLEAKIARKVVSQGIRAGMKVVQKEVKTQAAVDTGRMRRSTKVRAAKSRKRGEIKLNVIISSKDGGLTKTSKSGKKAFYPALVEFGHHAGKANALVRLFHSKARSFGAGSVKPDPFMDRAFKNSRSSARKIAIATILSGIEREAGKP